MNSETPNTPIKTDIHEFSTGIGFKGTADNWVSTGDTGQVMNRTIEAIPDVVKRSIANDEFKLAEYGYTGQEQPAIIGRVVGSAESAWSVIAIATPGPDDKGRYAPYYRYFLYEGNDGLPKILAWIKAYQKQEGRFPVFNPFKTRTVGKPNISEIPITPFQDLDEQTKSWLSNQTTPVIIQPGQLNLQPGQHPTERLNQLATEKAETNDQPISWAFNVLTLEEIGRFQIIQAANSQAYQSLQEIKNTSPKALPPVVADKQKLKSTIKALMNSSHTAKVEHLSTIADVLADEKVTQDEWNKFFDAEGATKAINGNLYNSGFVNLLTLRAIVIPDTLPEYLDWLENGEKNHHIYKIADDFQSAIANIFDNNDELKQSFQKKLTQGLQTLLFSLLEEKISVKSIEKFFTSINSLWKEYSQEFIKNVDENLDSFFKSDSDKDRTSTPESPSKSTDEFIDKIKSDLQYCLSNPNNKLVDKKYEDVGLFFEVLKAGKIALLFYRLGYGKVPKEKFEKLSNKEWSDEIYGITVERDTTVIESSILLLTKIMTWKLEFSGFLFLNILFITFISGVAFNSLFPEFVQINSIQDTKKAGNSTSVIEEDISNNKFMNAALAKFDTTTSKAIKKLVQGEKEKLSQADKNKLEQLKKILNHNKKLQYGAITGELKENNQKKEWVQAIYNYQYKNKLRADGIISENEPTYQQIIASLESTPTLTQTPTPTPTLTPTPTPTPTPTLTPTPTPTPTPTERSTGNKDGCWWIWLGDLFC